MIHLNLISIPGETDQTEEKLQTPVVERRSTEGTELDLSTESVAKIIEYIIEMTVLKSDENKRVEGGDWRVTR